MAQYDDTLLFGTGLDDTGIKSGLTSLSNYVTTFSANISAQIAGSVTSALAAIPQKITEIGTQFESSMSQVAATMGISQTAAEFEQLSAAAKEMGESTKFSASQAADALNYLALAGYDANKSCAALPTVLNLAAAGGIELSEASDMVTDSMSALGLSMDELDSFADKMAKTSQKSNTSVAQLGQSILSVGANAQILAGGTTELMTELGILADSGQKSAEAGTALARVIKNLSTPTSAATAELERLRVEAYDSEGNFRNMQDIFVDLQEAMKDFTAEEKQASLSEIFDTAALSSAKILIAQAGERFDELSGYIDNADGAAAQMAETMSDNLAGDITICQSALEGLANTAYEKFQGTMRTAVQAVTADVGTLTESMKNGELSESMDTLAEAFSNAASSAARLVADDAIPAVIKGFTLIVEHGNAIISVLVGIGTTLTALKAVDTVTKLVKGFQEAQLQVALFAMSNNIAAMSATELAGSLSLSEIAVGLLTKKITLVTAAQAAWNAVCGINPYVMLAAALAGLAAGITAYAIKASEATEATKNAETALNNAASAIDNLNDSIEKNSSETKKNEDELRNKIQIYEELRQQYEKTGEGEEQLKNIMQEIQELSPTTISFIDEETGAYLSLADSIDEVIAAMERKREMSNLDSTWNTAKDNLDGLYKQQQALKEDEADLYEQLENANVISAGYIHNKIAKNREQQLAIADAILENERTVADTEKKIKAMYLEDTGSGESKSGSTDYSTVGGTIAAEEQRKGEEANARLEQTLQDLAEDRERMTAKLQEEWDKADHEYSVGTIKTDEELYAKKAEIWAQYGDESIKDHWRYQEDLISLGNKLTETERANAEKAAKEAAEAERQAEEERLKAEEKATAEEERIRKDKWSHIAKLENLGLITEEQAYEQRKAWIEEYCPEYSDEWYEYYKTVYDYEQDFSERQLEERKEMLNEELTAVKSNIDSIISEYKSAYSEIQSNIAGYKSQLLSVAGNVFEVVETENEDGTKTRSYKVNDIKAQIDKMRQYHAAMIEMRDKGASVSLLQEMQNLDPDDGLQMAKYMLSSGDFEEINALYKERDKIAQELAEDFYSPDIEALNSSTTDKILDEYSDLPDEFYLIGKNAAQELILGISDGMGDLSDVLEVSAAHFDDPQLSYDGLFSNTLTGGKTLADRFSSAGSISSAAEANQANAASGVFSESILNGFAQKILDGIKNIKIKNQFVADLNVDGKTMTEVVNETNQTLGRMADA